MSESNSRSHVIVVGAGLSGLACALALTADGTRVTLFESSDRPGGRIKTDIVDGFRIDRGFQVLLDSYPEAKSQLDLKALQLRPFEPGARIFTGSTGRFASVTDPLRRPWESLKGLGVASARDVVAAWRMNSLVRTGAHDAPFNRPETTSLARLYAAGFSATMIETFFRPFYGGVLLDRSLSTSSRLLEYYWRYFVEGRASLPRFGMEEIPKHLAAKLPSGTLRCGTRVAATDGNGVTLADGSQVVADAVVIATEMDECRRLSHDAVIDQGWRGTVMLAYDAPRAPITGAWLVLDGTGKGPINHVAVPSEVSPDYAPEGRSLVYASSCDNTEGDDVAIDTSFRGQLRCWFGESVDAWRPIRTIRIRRALPARYASPFPREAQLNSHLRGNLFAAGDHLETGSINGALASGRRAAKDVAAALASSYEARE